MTKKEFALEQIKEYIQDPSRCGFDKEKTICVNITDDGKMCVASKNYLPKIRKMYACGAVSSILYQYPQESVFIPSSVNILTTEEWQWLQSIHDHIAIGDINGSKWFEYSSALFSYEELIALREEKEIADKP